MNQGRRRRRIKKKKAGSEMRDDSNKGEQQTIEEGEVNDFWERKEEMRIRIERMEIMRGKEWTMQWRNERAKSDRWTYSVRTPFYSNKKMQYNNQNCIICLCMILLFYLGNIGKFKVQYWIMSELVSWILVITLALWFGVVRIEE